MFTHSENSEGDFICHITVNKVRRKWIVEVGGVSWLETTFFVYETTLLSLRITQNETKENFRANK